MDQQLAGREGRRFYQELKLQLKPSTIAHKILPEYQLRIITIDSGRCDSEINQFKFLPPLVLLNSNSDMNITAGLGLVCPNVVQQVVQLENPIVVPSVISSVTNSLKAQAMNSGLLIEAILSFMEHMEWSKFGVITDSQGTFFLSTAEALLKAVKHNSNFTVSKVIQLPDVIESNLPKIIFVSMSAPNTVKVLCSAYRQNLHWPKHVWILHSYWLEDFN